ncbi:MAG TPA: DNA recombination protein RmuC [Patescibacteria group bacterium]|nr:DNA recombination protein RmuC [Patescibacteria group bacterium]
MQTTILSVILALFVIGFGIVFWLLLDLKHKTEKPPEDTSIKLIMDWMQEIKQDVKQDRDQTQKNIHETNKQINDRLTEAARVIGKLQQDIGIVTQIGPDVRRLSEVLASPKARGNFGEEMLENMLRQVLPQGSYSMQYKFKNGEIVDAMVRVGEMILPVDSKFSMENFRLMKEAKTDETEESLRKAFLKDVKKRIDEIHKKYILPQEGTFDFALMYVPSEGIYQEIIMDEDIQTYARNKRVMPVSPNSLFIYLQNIVVSLRGQEINKMAQQILAMITGIKQESDKFGRNLEILGKHIVNAGNTMGTVNGDFLKLQTSIQNAANLKLESPQEAEQAKLLE